jgi:hypothetical protein
MTDISRSSLPAGAGLLAGTQSKGLFPGARLIEAKRDPSTAQPYGPLRSGRRC